MTTGSSTSNTTQQSQTSPWAPTQGLLQSLLGQLGGLNTGLTSGQSTALSNLNSSLANLPNFTPQLGGLASNLLNPTGSINSSWTQNLGNLQNSLSPYLTSGFTNASTNPQVQGDLNAITQQVNNATNGQFAAAGRSLSPANTGAAAYNITQAEAPTLLNEQNTLYGLNQGAAGTLYNAGNTTQQGILGNMLSGGQLAGMLPGLAAGPAMAQLQAANTAYGTPFSNLGSLESMLLPIAGLGSQSYGTGTTTGTSTPSFLSDILGGLGLFGGQYSPISGFGNFLKGL